MQTEQAKGESIESKQKEKAKGAGKGRKQREQAKKLKEVLDWN